MFVRTDLASMALLVLIGRMATAAHPVLSTLLASTANEVRTPTIHAHFVHCVYVKPLSGVVYPHVSVNELRQRQAVV